MGNKKESIIFIVSIILLIGAAFAIGNVTKKSFVDDVSKGSLEKYGSSLRIFKTESLDGESEAEKIKDLEALEKFADLILRVSITSDKEYKAYSLLTKCSVLETYKNKDKISLKKDIYIYDPSWYSVPHTSYMGMEGYNFLKEGEEYIVFLNSLKMPKEYKPNEEEQNRFVFTNTKISRFNLNKNDNLIYVEEEKLDNGLDYEKFKDYERIFTSKEELEDYKKIRNKVLNGYYGGK